jgi:hypothetical protein
VWGIYHALIGIGAAGQATLDKVAGPVGESLVMTAGGLAVAIPAVLGYNALVRGNKEILASLKHFAHDLHAYLVTGGRVKKTAANVHPLPPQGSTMSFGNSSLDDDGEVMSEINMTPLVDVMLVLLIIFIITVPVINHAVKLDLPKASSQAEEIKPEKINLSIKADGGLGWNGESVADDASKPASKPPPPAAPAGAAPAGGQAHRVRPRGPLLSRPAATAWARWPS